MTYYLDRANLRDRMRARMAPRAGGWFDIRNADGDTAVIRIYDEISWWGVTADDFARQLALVTASNIEVQINSPGGDVFDGLAIYNALRAHSAHVTTRVDGLAASAASVIVQAGEHRVMLGAAQMMIHEAWGVAVGPAREIREFADLLDTENEVIAGIYAQRSDGEVDKFLELMAAETWLTDQAAVDLGLADEVVQPGGPDNTTTRPAPSAGTPPEPTPDPPPAAVFDPAAHVDKAWVRQMFGSTALAD